VNAALDRHPIELDRDRYLRRTLALELARLDELKETFRRKANSQKDTAAGALLVKIYERRATLLGLNPPIGHAVRAKTSDFNTLAVKRSLCALQKSNT
jgi:hypothetical protein